MDGYLNTTKEAHASTVFPLMKEMSLPPTKRNAFSPSPSSVQSNSSRIIKLSRKQKLRKDKRKERGEALVDQRDKKAQRDAKRLDQRLTAKALW